MKEQIAITFDEVIGKTVKELTKGDDHLVLYFEDGCVLRMYHRQDCCEKVEIDDICGDLNDLLSAPLMVAECVKNIDLEPKNEYDFSYTWTFYRFATKNGYVTIKWYGESNGYYSEDVDTELYENEEAYDYGSPIKEYQYY